MPTFTFHNNYHRSNHHTVHLSGFPESSSDPIASLDYPFLGLFYNNYYDASANFLGQSNSFDWWSVHTSTLANSAIWELYPTTYTTVKENSGFEFYGETVDLGLPNGSIASLGYGDNKFVGFISNSVSAFHSQDDGETWTITKLSSAGFPNQPNIVKVNYVNGKFIALGNIGQEGFKNSYYSENGINWIPIECPKNIFWNSIKYGNDIYVAHGNNSIYTYSNDGISWFTNEMPASGIWYTEFADGKFVSICNAASGAYSYDGISWTLYKMPFVSNYTGLVYGDGKFITTTNSISGAYSYDGINWEPTLIADGDRFHSSNVGTRSNPIYDGEKFIVSQALGSNQNFIQSYDGINFWKRYPRSNLYRMTNPRAHNEKGVLVTGRSLLIPTIPNATLYLWKTRTKQWSKNINVYQTYSPLSTNWISYATTVLDNYQYWNDLHDEYRMYDDVVQENTAQKTFSALKLQPNDIENIVWDLTAGQVSYFVATDTSNFSGFVGAKKGGIYNLILVTDSTCNSSLSVNFNPDKFKFSSNTYSYSITGIYLRKFQFIYDGSYMYASSAFLYDVNPQEGNLYYSGAGIILYENFVTTNPVILDSNQTIFTQIGGGLTVSGPEPYTGGSGLNVAGAEYNRNFIFSFSTQNALCAMSPYGQLGSQDRIDILNPYLSATNATIKNNTIDLNRCKSYDAIKITTRAYGYISELIVNDEEITNFTFPATGFDNHETGHLITANPNYDAIRAQSIFVKYGDPVPIIPSLSSGISLWLDAMDYSSVGKLSSESSGDIYVLGLSSKTYSNSVYFSSLSSSNTYYNTAPKQSFNYNLSSTHYRELILSGNRNFATFTVLTPSISSSNREWLWVNGNYGIFKIPNQYSLGIGTSGNYYTYDYGREKANTPVCVTTRYLSANRAQAVFINGGGIIDVRAVSAIFDSNFNNYTMVGGYDPLTGYSRFRLHELIMYDGNKNNTEASLINNYLLDKWKFIGYSGIFDQDAELYFTKTFVNSPLVREAINEFVVRFKEMGLWDSSVLWLLRNDQNIGSGNIVYSLGGLGEYNATLVNNPTWSDNGIIFTSSQYATTNAPAVLGDLDRSFMLIADTYTSDGFVFGEGLNSTEKTFSLKRKSGNSEYIIDYWFNESSEIPASKAIGIAGGDGENLLWTPNNQIYEGKELYTDSGNFIINQGNTAYTSERSEGTYAFVFKSNSKLTFSQFSNLYQIYKETIGYNLILP